MSDAQSKDHKTEDRGHGEAVGHVVGIPILAGTWIALMILTIVTVAVTYVDLGELNIVIALAIATFKASLVALFFMHLRYDAPFNGLVLLFSLLLVLFFILMAILDTFSYAPDLIPGYAPGMIER